MEKLKIYKPSVQSLIGTEKINIGIINSKIIVRQYFKHTQNIHKPSTFHKAFDNLMYLD